MPSFDDQAASRRKFLQFLAASPLLAARTSPPMAAEAPSRLPDPHDLGAAQISTS